MRKIVLGLILVFALSFGTGFAENWVYFANDEDGNWWCRYCLWDESKPKN